MTTYHFELVFRLHQDEDPSAHFDALFEAGCNDSSPSTGKTGMIGLTFDREAASAIDAISSAFENVNAAIPYAHIERISQE
ncbi:DNA-binding protein [Ketobacter sp. MCCC 1A13808]|uniref:DNA-binding protein n=1 Tax=Ketobacter sp. MCCC 1A13808 TaxID=2602738 RepID=UPI0012EC6F91|nr:DNA-binding protein [Ketobacter sp. MCCC 1A13808]MVF14650.1 DNA-binding protein [Ketobacter sp. MCCC 1A13808]